MNKGAAGEISLYPQILNWLQGFLESKNSNSKVKTYDVHATDLSDFFERYGYKKFFPEYATYKIRVDLLGVVIADDVCELTFVEVKDTPISLNSLSQLLGYCKILKPDRAFLISPRGLSKPMSQLLTDFGRLDILEFQKGKFVTVAKWNASRNAIENDTAIPPIGYRS